MIRETVFDGEPALDVPRWTGQIRPFVDTEDEFDHALSSSVAMVEGIDPLCELRRVAASSLAVPRQLLLPRSRLSLKVLSRWGLTSAACQTFRTCHCVTPA